MDLALARQSAGPTPPPEALRQALREAIVGKDLSSVSIGELRQQAAQRLGLAPNGLESRKEEVTKLTTSIVQQLQLEQGRPGGVKSLLEQLLEQKGERSNAVQWVYLVTISHVIEASLSDGRPYANLQQLSRQHIGEAIRDAFDKPVPNACGGRPRAAPGGEGEGPSLVAFVVVFRELHSDGSVHFHAVVRLTKPYRFGSAKRTLRERHQLPSHWSCTHSQVWSAMRYLHIGTPTKHEVDSEPWQWTADAVELDLFALSQQPFEAALWRKRREAKDKAESQEPSDKKARASFTKLDLTALIISKHLFSKDSLLAYVQDHGTVAMQAFVNKNQRRLTADIDDAKEWAAAKEKAGEEMIPDWDLVHRCANGGCTHPEGLCPYKEALQDIFHRNRATVDYAELAAALRDIIVKGPTKTTRVPFLVGPSNSGKSTIVYPFDDLFSPARVLHKPALGSSFALRNLAGGHKRFIFWDDFRPVEYAQEKTVPVSLFLSLFIGKSTEIQVSQSFNDGNKDVQWNRGVVFTAKQDGLWQPTRRVGEEDIRHMRNRVREFPFLQPLPDGALKEVAPCAPCMCQWLVSGAAAWDAASNLQVAQPVPVASGWRQRCPLDTDRVSAIVGLRQALEALKLPRSMSEAIVDDLEKLGAISLTELTLADWESLESWAALRPLQKRRLAQYVRTLFR